LNSAILAVVVGVAAAVVEAVPAVVAFALK
jgi:hypothetical protein